VPSSEHRTKYRILGQVGRGQFGRVFCARNKNQLVALKELEHQRFPTNKFLRELRFLLSLQHPNIVSCISLDYSQNRRYLVMEYCEAGTLRDLIERSLDFKTSINLVIEILGGLHHAHSLNIIHCDIKPENILLKVTKTGWQAKVSDFGIARLAQEQNREGNTGSPGYMAPERFYGKFSAASDLYAVGIILYELLLGQRPFSGRPQELMVAHLNQRLNIPDRLPESLKNFLIKSLEKLPQRRFASALIMQQELINIVKNISSLANQGSNPSIDLRYSSQCLLKENLASGLVALDCLDGINVYSATRFNLELQQYPVMGSVQLLFEFEEAIANLILIKTLIFVVTATSVYRIEPDVIELGQSKSIIQTLFNCSQKFSAAIDRNGKWIAIAFDKTLEIHGLNKVFKVNLKEQVIAIAAIDSNHFAVISNKLGGSEILIFTRKGHLIWQYDLPMAIALGIASSTKLILVTDTQPGWLLLINLKPYRLNRIAINYYQPIFLKSTPWGYIIASKLDDPNQDPNQQSLIHLLDLDGNHVNSLKVNGIVTAIAVIENHILAIATSCGSVGKYYVVNLKHLDIDLIF
jgi:serine/threonine protein kinase